MAQVTAAWQKRDTPRAFVRSLEDMGYILATGTRDYVLVDLLRQHEQPAEADRRQESPDQAGAGIPRARSFRRTPCRRVDEARALAAGASRRDGAVQQRRGTGRAGSQAEEQRREELQRKQQTPPPRCGAGEQGAGRPAAAGPARTSRAARRTDRAEFRQGYLQESQRIRLDRAAHRPKGLAAFIGRITGVELITKKIQQYRDKTRYEAFLAQKKELAERQQRETAALERRAGAGNSDHAAPPAGAGAGRTA